MLPNTACELLLSHLLSNIKNPSFLAQNLSFCQIDIWDSVLLLNCPAQEVFEFILKSKKSLVNAISKQLPAIKLVHLRCQQRVVDITINYLIGKQTDHPLAEFHLVIANLIKQSAKPVLVTKLDGEILFAYSPPRSESFPVKSIYLNAMESKRMADTIESHGWVNGYQLKLCRHNLDYFSTTVRARYAKDSLLNELILVIQILNTESIKAVPLRDVV